MGGAVLDCLSFNFWSCFASTVFSLTKESKVEREAANSCFLSLSLSARVGGRERKTRRDESQRRMKSRQEHMKNQGSVRSANNRPFTERGERGIIREEPFLSISIWSDDSIHCCFIISLCLCLLIRDAKKNIPALLSLLSRFPFDAESES